MSIGDGVSTPPPPMVTPHGPVLELPRARRTLDTSITSAVLRGASHILVEDGFVGLTVADVARRANVHRPAVYRRWATKLDLARDAVDETMAHLAPSPSGHLRDDLDRLMRALLSPVDGYPSPALVLGAVLVAPELRRIAWGPSTGRLRMFLGHPAEAAMPGCLSDGTWLDPSRLDLILGTAWMLALRKADPLETRGAVELLAAAVLGTSQT